MHLIHSALHNFTIHITFLTTWIVLSFSIPVSLKAQQTAKRSDKGVGYLEYLPGDYHTSNKQYPAIVFLHGSGERGDGSPNSLESLKKHGPPKHIENGETMCFNNNGVEECFIVLSPQTNRWSFVGYEMIPFVQYALQQYRIDPNRVYLTGLSMGGEGTWNLAYSIENTSNFFAALAPIAGRGSYQDACIIAEHQLPVWAFHGANDGAISLHAGRTPINGMNLCNADPAPIFTVYEGTGHAGTWQRAYRTDNSLHTPNLYQWFLTQTKSGSSSTDIPVAPTSLVSDFKSTNKVSLAWVDNSNNETNFLIERSLSANSNFHLIESTESNITYFEDSQLSPNTQYYYRIRAKNNEGSSSYTNTLAVKTSADLPNEPGNSIVIDNQHSSVIKTGDWAVSTAGGSSKYGVNYLHDDNNQKGLKRLTFHLDLEPGTYEVFGWWYAYSNRATNTPFEINSDDGSTTIYKNQTQNNAQWVSLGTYTFSSTATVMISNENTDGYVVIDALKFESSATASTNPEIEIILDNKDSEISTTGYWASSTHGGSNKYAEDYFHDGNAEKGNKSISFSASVTSGQYEVFARWYAYSNRATNTPFEIITSNGVETVFKNQQINNAEWQSLGSYDFQDVAEVIIKNDNTDGYVVADAIKIVSINTFASATDSKTKNITKVVKPISLEDVLVFPNPVQNTFSISSPFKEEKTFYLKMRGETGLIEWEQQVHSVGEFKLYIDRAKVSSGIKYLIVEVEGEQTKILQLLLL